MGRPEGFLPSRKCRRLPGIELRRALQQPMWRGWTIVRRTPRQGRRCAAAPRSQPRRPAVRPPSGRSTGPGDGRARRSPRRAPARGSRRSRLRRPGCGARPSACSRTASGDPRRHPEPSDALRKGSAKSPKGSSARAATAQNRLAKPKYHVSVVIGSWRRPACSPPYIEIENVTAEASAAAVPTPLSEEMS